VIDDALKNAYNEYYKDSEYAIIGIVDEQTWVEPATNDDYVLPSWPDTDDNDPYGRFVLFTLVDYSCQLCGNNDDASAVLEQMELTGGKKKKRKRKTPEPPPVNNWIADWLCQVLWISIEDFDEAHNCAALYGEEDYADLSMTAE
jgi:hypothetical protein